MNGVGPDIAKESLAQGRLRRRNIDVKILQNDMHSWRLAMNVLYGTTVRGSARGHLNYHFLSSSFFGYHPHPWPISNNQTSTIQRAW